MTRIFLVILIVGISRVYGQDHSLQVKQLLDSASSLWYADFNKTEELVSKAETLIRLSERGHAADILKVYQLRALSCQAFSRLQLWREYLDKIDSLLIQHKSELGFDFQYLVLRNEFTRAQYYVQIDHEVQALRIFERLQAEFKKLPESIEVCERLFVICNDVASIHLKRGEYEAAVNRFLAGIPYFDCGDRASGRARPRTLIYRNLGRAYLEKGDFVQAGRYLKLADRSIQEFLKDDPVIASRFALSLFETQATYFVEINQKDSALLAMQKALPLLSLKNIDNEFRGRINQRLGNLYLLEGKFNEAKRYFDQAEGFFLNAQGWQSFYLAGLYLGKAELFEKQESIDEALKYCDRAIEKLDLNFKTGSENPDLRDVISKKYLFSALQLKSRLQEQLSVTKNNISFLFKAYATNQLSLALLDSTANEFSLDKDKIILSEQGYVAFENGIRISNRLYQQTKEEKYFNNVISLIEKSKGNLLLENLRLVNRFSGIKQEWLEREKELKAEMLLTEQSIYGAEAKGATSELQKSRERYATIKRDYSTLIEQIKREAPDYYKLRFDHSVASVEVIQQQLLKPHEALIEFFVGDSILAVAGFTKDKKYLKVKPMLGDFTAKMSQFRTALTTSGSEFYKLSNEFYDFLLKDCLAELGGEIKSLTIVPDGLLGYLPFEVLMPSRDNKVAYLNDYFSIHYANSATYLMEQMQRKPSEAKNFFAGFVSSGSVEIPSEVVTRDQQFATLQGAEHEVSSITGLLSSGFTVFNPANKLDFKDKASDYKILHFAMHSSLNDKNPMMSVMIFSEADSSENLLSAIELYSMKLNSELAVLSACNTGVGQLHRGEGIMSFSRAFAYAGVPSAVISLWKVPDIATSKIMVSFYSHLKTGESKDKALQLARLEFVKNNPEMAHPYFWAGFILNGNNSPLSFPQSYFWWWVGISMLVLSALFLARKNISSRFSQIKA